MNIYKLVNQKELIEKYIRESEDKFAIEQFDTEYDELMKSHYAYKYLEMKKKSNKIVREYDIVDYDNKKYIVGKVLNYKREIKLFVADYDDYDKIKSLYWNCSNKGYIYAAANLKKYHFSFRMHVL